MKSIEGGTNCEKVPGIAWNNVQDKLRIQVSKYIPCKESTTSGKSG
jgi:hypothetical protein